MRKLASIRRINNIRPIENADAIECAVVDGWNVVIQKGTYNIGDLVIYCEVDSFIPHELAPFLSRGQEPKEYEGIKGERLRTIKLRGQLSQGLILPVDLMSIDFTYGDDVSEHLGIIKYDPPIPACLAGEVAGPWPSAIPKTDQERIQNLTGCWEDISNRTYEATEKLEGCSMTVGMVNGEFIVCSRALNLKRNDNNSLWKVAIADDIERKLKEANLNDIVFQGELVGEGIQGNIYKLKGQHFYVYDVYDIHYGTYYNAPVRQELCEQMRLKHVPVIDSVHVLESDVGIEERLANGWGDGFSLINPNVLREGIVFKDLLNPENHFKVISNAYLVKQK